MRIHKSRTILFAAALAGLSVVQGTLAQLPLSPTIQMFIGVGVAAGIAALRILTEGNTNGTP